MTIQRIRSIMILYNDAGAEHFMKEKYESTRLEERENIGGTYAKDRRAIRGASSLVGMDHPKETTHAHNELDVNFVGMFDCTRRRVAQDCRPEKNTMSHGWISLSLVTSVTFV